MMKAMRGHDWPILDDKGAPVLHPETKEPLRGGGSLLFYWNDTGVHLTLYSDWTWEPIKAGVEKDVPSLLGKPWSPEDLSAKTEAPVSQKPQKPQKKKG